MIDNLQPAMIDADKSTILPERTDIMREMAQDMSVALYRRYGRAAAAKILSIPSDDLTGLCDQGRIGYLALSDDQISFFGCQLLTYLLECVVPPGSEPRPRSTPAANKPVANPEAELMSVDDAIARLGIGKTKFYELMKTKQITSVKIGSRTLIKRTELREFIDKQIG